MKISLSERKVFVRLIADDRYTNASAEATGIKIEGTDKWLTMITNASRQS